METDWEVEIGPGAPIIDAQWSGFVDLTSGSALAGQLPEAIALPALADALARLNGAHSPVWTSKCDVWPVVDPEDFDADEMNAAAEEAAHAWASYVDLLPGSGLEWTEPETAVVWSKSVCASLHEVSLPCSRLDLVVRRAFVTPDRASIGITAYLTGCGATSDEAKSLLGRALGIFADALVGRSTLK